MAGKSELKKLQTESAIEQVGGNHYQHFGMQPRVFWSRNNLPALPATALKHITCYEYKNGFEDLQKAKQYIEFMIEDYFGDEDPVMPAMLRTDWVWKITPEEYCRANSLSREQSAVVKMICEFSAREHLEAAIAIINDMSVDFVRAYGEHVSATDRIKLLREQVGRKNDVIYIGVERVREYQELAAQCIGVALRMQERLPKTERLPLREDAQRVVDRIDKTISLMLDEFKITAKA